MNKDEFRAKMDIMDRLILHQLILVQEAKLHLMQLEINRNKLVEHFKEAYPTPQPIVNV